MPTDPNNDRYSVPVSRGGEPYDQYHNANFDALATDVPESGPFADRPSASNEFAPERYYATDKQVEYFNTGSSWRKLNVGEVALTGDLQSTLDSVGSAGGGYVRLKPGETFDEGSEIFIPENVTLDCRGAEFVVSGDYNGLFLDNSSSIYGLDLEVTATGYSSSAVVIDSSRSSRGDYTGPNGVEIHGQLQHNDDRSSGSKGLDIQALGGPVGINNYVQLGIFTFEKGINVTGDAWVNGVRFHGCHLNSNGHHVYHEGTGSGETSFACDIYCVTQSGPNVTSVVTNTTSSTSATLIGEMWDVANMDTSTGASAVDGTLITIKTRDFLARPFADVSPNAGAGSIAFGWGNGHQTMLDLESGTQWQWTHDSGERVMARNGTSVMKYNADTSEPEVVGDGSGLVVTTPDGSARYRIAVDNSGALTTTQI